MNAELTPRQQEVLTLMLPASGIDGIDGLDAPEAKPHTRPHAAVPRLVGTGDDQEPGYRACGCDKSNVGLALYSDGCPRLQALLDSAFGYGDRDDPLRREGQDRGGLPGQSDPRPLVGRMPRAGRLP